MIKIQNFLFIVKIAGGVINGMRKILVKILIYLAVFLNNF